MLDLTGGREWLRAPFDLMFQQTVDRTPSRIWVADQAPPVWMARFETFPIIEAEADALEAQIMGLRGALVPFWCHTARRPVPLSVEAETAPALGAPVVAGIGADRDALSLSGLPAGFVLSAGDFVSVDLGADRAALIRLVGSGVADGAGVTPAIPVVPGVAAGVAVGMAARLDRPRMAAQMVPGSYSRASDGYAHEIIAFQVQEV
ncbi:MAG: hypothetical protein CMM86_09295 [Rhodovulum sp.]|nr:hypothetical protein [Rhodovulum sp.]